MERSVAAKIHEEINSAVNEVLKKYGFTLAPSNMRYGDYDLSMTIKANAINESGKKEINPQLMRWAKNRLASFDPRWNDVPMEDIFSKKWFVSGIGYCTIEDYNTRRRKYPFDVRAEDGKGWRVTARSIKFEH
jgi:hypothetical protein